MRNAPEYRDLLEIRRSLEYFRDNLNTFNLRFAKTDFRTDDTDEPDPFILTGLIRMADRIIDLHRDISQTDIIRMLAGRLTERMDEGERQALSEKLGARNVTLTAEDLADRTLPFRLTPEQLRILLYLLV